MVVLVLTACPGGQSSLPGELVAPGAFELGEVVVDQDTIYWTERPQNGLALHGYEQAKCSPLSSAPFNADRASSLGSSFTSLFIDEGRVVVTQGDFDHFQVKAVSKDGSAETLVASTSDVGVAIIDRTGSEPLVVWSTGATVWWQTFGGTSSVEVELVGAQSVRQLAATPAFIYAGTVNGLGPNGSYGELWRIDRQSKTTTRISRAEDWKEQIPGYDSNVEMLVRLTGGHLPEYLSGQLLADGDAVIWMVSQFNFNGDPNRAVLVRFSEGKGPVLLANQLVDTSRFFLHVDELFWHESVKSQPEHPHRFWRAPRAGGSPVLVGELDVRAVAGGFAYFYLGFSLRRVSLTAASP